MTVFALHPNDQHDRAADVAQFGAIRYINDRYVYGDELAPDGGLPPSFLFNMRAAARDFDPGEDYLLIDGDHVQMIAFTAELLEYFKEFRVLRWDRQAKGYFAVVIRPYVPGLSSPTQA